MVCVKPDFDAGSDFASTSQDCFLDCEKLGVQVKSFCGPNVANITPSPLQFATGVCTNASSGGFILANSEGQDRHQAISEIQITDEADSFFTVTGVANPNLPDDGIYTKRTTITIFAIPPFPYDLVENESTLVARSGLTTISATFDKK